MEINRVDENLYNRKNYNEYIEDGFLYNFAYLHYMLERMTNMSKYINLDPNKEIIKSVVLSKTQLTFYLHL